MRSGGFWHRRAAIVAGCCALALAGCARQEPLPPYVVISGVVKAVDRETGELFVRSEKPPSPWHADRNVPCVATKDSELYINDRFGGIQNVEVSDTLEAVGYRDHDRLVLALVNILRSEADPALPAFANVTTRPAPTGPEE